MLALSKRDIRVLFGKIFVSFRNFQYRLLLFQQQLRLLGGVQKLL